MEKLKYLIILALTLFCMIMFYQYYQYKYISKELILQNNKLDIEVSNLRSKNTALENTIEKLNIQIDEQNEKALELERLNRQLLMNYDQESSIIEHETNDSKEYEQIDIQSHSESIEESLNIEEEKSMFDLPVDSKIKLDEKNNIDSLEFQIQKDF